jgi:hypothetical protein
MPDIRVRGQIALLAARMMYAREESEYFTAKRKAARQLGVEYRYHPGDLPSNAEIREQLGALAQLYEGDRRQDNLKAMRLDALRMMRLLDAFHPRLIGSTLTGHVRQGSDIDLHVFTNHISAVATAGPAVIDVIGADQRRDRLGDGERVVAEVRPLIETDISIFSKCKKATDPPGRCKSVRRQPERGSQNAAGCWLARRREVSAAQSPIGAQSTEDAAA